MHTYIKREAGALTAFVHAMYSLLMHGSRILTALLIGAFMLLPPASARAQDVGTVLFASGLSSPTYVTAPAGDFTRLFVTELAGEIEILDATTGAQGGVPFLTIPGVDGEGLQGLAFHPDYATNGFFYVYYFDNSASHLVRYTRSANPDLADGASAFPILTITQPFGNHNGGWIGFGPDDFLYVPVGDGGSQHDPSDNGQSITGELLGNVLRIDVDGDDFPGDAGRNYAIPSDNPFVGITGEDEIWAYGLRNPFRASFDRATGDFYIADVGQNTHEEIDFQLASSGGGENYGWRLREAFVATPTGGVGGAQPPDGVDPIHDYDHGTGDDQGNSVTGGYVYRGPIPSINGKYFFGDYQNERIWSIEHNGVVVTEYIDWTSDFVPDIGTIDQIVGFGEDANGNLYIVDLGGQVFRVFGPVGGVPALGGDPRALLVLLPAAVLVALIARRRARASFSSA